MKEFDQPAGLAIKLKTRLIKLPKLFNNSLFNLACKSDHVNNVSDTYNAKSIQRFNKWEENRISINVSQETRQVK